MNFYYHPTTCLLTANATCSYVVFLTQQVYGVIIRANIEKIVNSPLIFETMYVFGRTNMRENLFLSNTMCLRGFEIGSGTKITYFSELQTAICCANDLIFRFFLIETCRIRSYNLRQCPLQIWQALFQHQLCLYDDSPDVQNMTSQMNKEIGAVAYLNVKLLVYENNSNASTKFINVNFIKSTLKNRFNSHLHYNELDLI